MKDDMRRSGVTSRRTGEAPRRKVVGEGEIERRKAPKTNENVRRSADRKQADISRRKSLDGGEAARRRREPAERVRRSTTTRRKKQNPVVDFFTQIANAISNMNAADHILVITGVVVLFLAVVTGFFYASKKISGGQVGEFASIGSDLNEISVMGESTLMAVTDNYVAHLDLEDDEEIADEDYDDESEEKDEDRQEEDEITLNLNSVERDLKIKFVNKKTGKVIKGIAFQVEVKTPSGDTDKYTNDDRDGIIYKKDMKPGKYEVALLEIDDIKDYIYSTSPVSITIKEKIEYKKIEVADEIKTEAEVNVAAEDTQKKDAESAPALTDTVEWVESTKKAIGGEDEDKNDGENSYIKVDMDDILDPEGGTTSTDSDSSNKTAEADISILSIRNGGRFEFFEGNVESPENSDTPTEECSHSWEKKDTIKEATCKEGGEVEYKCSKCGETKTESTSKTSNHDWPDYDSDGKRTCKVCGKEETDSSKAEHKHDYKLEKTVEPTCEEGGYELWKCKNSGCDKPEEKRNEKSAKGHTEATKSENGKKITYCSVCNKELSSVDEDASLSGIEISGKQTFGVGDEETLKAEAKGTNIKADKIKWVEKENKDIVKIESNSGGEIRLKGKKIGKATFTVKYDDGKSSMSKEVTISVEDTEKLVVTVDKKTVPLKIQDTADIKVTIAGGRPAYKVELITEDDNYIQIKSNTTLKTDDKTFTFTIKRRGSDANKEEMKTMKVTIKVKDADEKTAEEYITVTSEDVKKDKNTKLTDKKGNQLYVIDKKTEKFREATLADYYEYKKFYRRNEDVTYEYTGWQTIDGKTYFFDKKGKPVTGEQVIKGVKYVFDGDGVLKGNNSGGKGLGIDVSKWNGSIDWEKVKNNGVDFAVIRCGYRGSSTGALIQDPKFKANINGAKNAGIKVGVYFFTQAVNEVEAVEEASMVLNMVGGGLSYPVYLDVESSGGRADGLGKSERTAIINAFLKTVQNGGLKAGVYANKTWLEEKMSVGSLSTNNIWLAQYAASPTYGGKYGMWQYTSKGQINGIKGYVDLDIAY